MQAGAFAIASSARGAIIPRIVEPDLVPAANTLNFTVGNVGQVVGPLFAGVLVGLSHGFAYAYGLDAILFTAALYSALRLPPLPPDKNATSTLGLRSVVEGLRFIATSPVLVMCFLVDIAAMVLAMPRALFPAVADDRFGGNVGPLYAAIAIGSVVAGLSSGWIGRVKRQGRALTFAVVGWGAAVALSGLAHQLWLVVALLAVAGAADLISAVYRQTILQTYAPDEMRGRMQGVFIAVVAGGPRLGDLRAGRHCGRDHLDDLVGRRRHRVHGRRPGRGRARASVLALPHRRCDRRLAFAPWRCPGTQYVIAAGKHEATIVEVGAGLRRYTVDGVDVTVPYGEDALATAWQRRRARPLAEPDPRRPLHVRRTGRCSCHSASRRRTTPSTGSAAGRGGRRSATSRRR